MLWKLHCQGPGRQRALTGLGSIILGVIACAALPANGSVQINFSDDAGAASAGFRIFASPAGGMSNVLEIGNDAGQTRGLNFLRISSASTGTDANDLIVTLPSMRLGARTPGPSGTGIDFYDLTFANGMRVSPGSTEGFRVYSATVPPTLILSADLTLTDHMLLTLGALGAIESGLGMNVTGVVLAAGAPTTLVMFRDQANAGGGADFLASVQSAGRNLSQQIMAGNSANGSASGSVNTPVPEPGSLLLLGVGVAAAVRRCRRC